MLPIVDPFLRPKALAAALNAAGVRGPGGHAWTPRAALRVVRALKASGAPVVRKKYARASDAVTFLAARPGWRPFSTRNPS